MGKELNTKLKSWRQAHLGKTRHGKKSGSEWRGIGVEQEMLGLCSVPAATEADEPLRPQRKTRNEHGEC